MLPLPDSASEQDASGNEYDDDIEEEDDYDDAEADEAAEGKTGRKGRKTKDDDSEDEDLSGWGDSKRDYYGADIIETEADAREEEQEAIRLQRRQLQGMKLEDYGLDDDDWLNEDNEDNADTDEAHLNGAIVHEVLPELDFSQPMSEEQIEKIFAARYPEFERLSRAFLDLQKVYEGLEVDVAAESVKLTETNGLPSLLLLKRNALASYLGCIAMYLAIFTSGSKTESGQVQVRSPADMRAHPVIEALVKTQAMWEQVKNMTRPKQQPLARDAANHQDPVPLPILKKPSSPDSQIQASEKPKKTKPLSKTTNAATDEAALQRAERIKRVEADLAKLSRPPSALKPREAAAAAAASHKPTIPTAASESDSDFGEIDALTAEEAEDKARRRKGLRFHTSKLTAKSAKRDRAIRDGGDADIPHRERLHDRQNRLNAAAEARGAAQDPRTDLGSGGSDSDAGDADRANAAEDDYYDMITAQAKSKKATKAADALALKTVKITGRVLETGDALGEEGKRVITYAIEKNKGLTPKRKKEGRNPRVKKRNKFEEKKKKLNSMRPQYKGGEGRGGYGGEKTGIRKNIVKSVKL